MRRLSPGSTVFPRPDRSQQWPASRRPQLPRCTTRVPWPMCCWAWRNSLAAISPKLCPMQLSMPCCAPRLFLCGLTEARLTPRPTMTSGRLYKNKAVGGARQFRLRQRREKRQKRRGSGCSQGMLRHRLSLRARRQIFRFIFIPSSRRRLATDRSRTCRGCRRCLTCSRRPCGRAG